MIISIGFLLSFTAQAAVGDVREVKIPESAKLTKEEKVEILINKQTPSLHLGRGFKEYQYLKNIAKGRSYYYRERYRKKNDRSPGYFSNVESDRVFQSFYKEYTTSDHLKMKKFYPRKKKIHYRDLFKFGPYKSKKD